MAEQFEHHGISGEYVMLPSGQLVPAADYQPPKQAETPTKPQPSKAKN
jgi:hypothetical protein